MGSAGDVPTAGQAAGTFNARVFRRSEIACIPSIALIHTMDTTAPPTLLRLPQVMNATGLARSTVYKLVAARSFPMPVRITGRSVAWHALEVQTWIGERSRAK
jgi:prophage regulatory protein